MNYHFTKGQFNEAELENAIIELFKEQGYTYVHGDMIERKYEDVLLECDLRAYLAERYANENLSEGEIQKIINRIALISSTPLYSGNKETFWEINNGFDLVRDDAEKLALHIDFINFDDYTQNRFKIVNQLVIKGVHTRIPDLLVYINGIPVAIWEFKSAIKEDTTIHDAWVQITKYYTLDIPNALKYCFLSVISDGANTRLGSIFTPYEFYYAWNKANEQDKVSNGISSLFTMIKGVFAKDRIISILRDFVLYPDNSDKEEVIVCRYPQYFAANKMLASLKAHKKPLGDGKGGIYFGATGCGKTYTMLFLCRMLAKYHREEFHNPTMLILVDREDLDDQTSKKFVNAKQFLCDENVRSLESREDLKTTLLANESGGVYITTIQKFCETTGLLSERDNIFCISDEAHRTQLSLGSKLKKTEKGLVNTYGFAQYLRWSFPNATYCGFTGTPIDESVAVFGDIVDSYTMKEASDDGITVRISYEPRLARVLLSEEQAKEIQKYYNKCAEQGSTPEQIEESQKAMSHISAILRHPDVLKRLANDIVTHYETLCAEKPNIVQKAMIVCADRLLAFKLLKEILSIRADWGVARKAENEGALTKEQLDKLEALPKINLVATQGKDDKKSNRELFELCGTSAYRKMLDSQFKDDNSNFRIAIVVDMWITGFDVPSLAVMYINKPLQKHTLVQTISRVNRVFDGKDKGLVVDYIGIKNSMMEAVKKYGSPQESPIDEINIALGIFRNHLSMLDELMINFNATRYYVGTPLERLYCLNDAAEYAQCDKEMQTRFMGLSRRLKSAYQIVFPTGELTQTEVAKAQFYMAIRSIIYKQTIGDAPDAEIMNGVVEEMVRKAITCTGVENIFDDNASIDLFSEEFLHELNNVKMPITKFNALLKLLRKAIVSYGRTNKVKSLEFDERLRRVVDAYNNRDKLIFTSEVVADFMDDLCNKIIDILNDLKEDQTSFEKLGISIEEKIFYDVLVSVRDKYGFKDEYSDERCLDLAKKMKPIVDDKIQYANWSLRSDIRSKLARDLIVLLVNNGYPPDGQPEAIDKVIAQAENFKKYN